MNLVVAHETKTACSYGTYVSLRHDLPVLTTKPRTNFVTFSCFMCVTGKQLRTRTSSVLSHRHTARMFADRIFSELDVARSRGVHVHESQGSAGAEYSEGLRKYLWDGDRQRSDDKGIGRYGGRRRDAMRDQKEPNSMREQKQHAAETACASSNSMRQQFPNRDGAQPEGCVSDTAVS